MTRQTISHTANIFAYAFGFALFSPVVALNFWAGGGWLDQNEVFFIPLILGSLLFFSYAFFTLEAGLWMKILLNTTMLSAEILGVPNISWPIGSQWWEAISLGFGLLSLSFIAFNLMVFGMIHAYKSLINKDANLKA